MTTRRRIGRRGATMIDLLGLVAVGAVMAALVLPQIRAAREAARRAQCTNNLKQIGLALHNYLSANDSFPMSHVLGRGRGNHHSGFTSLLPYMEQSRLYNAYNFDLENHDASNATAVGVRVASYLCPSNRAADPVPASEVRTAGGKSYPASKVKFAPGHYGMNWGGVREASGAEAARAYGKPFRGVLLTVVDPDAQPPTRNVKISDITDGTVFTLAAVEKRDSFGWAVGGWSGSEFDVGESPVGEGKDATARRAFTGSAHPGLVNALLCDGSVKPLTNKTDRAIWHALTTRAGGEVIEAKDLR